tara:strand:+ start:486 stop:1733 length:1248 start_codon:yes stop_codon:yes gene_type:complete
MKIKNYLNFKLRDISAGLFIFFSLLPWVNFGLNSRDSQVWPLLFGLVFLVFSIHKKVPVLFLYPIIIPILGFFSWFFLSDLTTDGIKGFIAIRGILSYMGFAICFTGLLFFLNDRKFPINMFLAINVVYLFVGILQTFFDPAIVSSIVASRDLTFSSTPFLARGVTGLTPEPTFFGIFLYFVSFIYLIIYDYKPPRKVILILLLNLISIILLTRSTMVLLFLIISIPFLIHRMNIIFISWGVLLTFLTVTITIFFFPETRFVKLANILIENPQLLELVILDESINDRISHVLFPLQGAVLNDMLPVGFHKWPETFAYLTHYWNGIFWYGTGGSIMSFFGLYIYEFGFFGLIIMGYIFIKIQDGTYGRFMETSLLFILLNTSIPPSFPLIAFIFAIYFYKNYRNQDYFLTSHSHTI